jgi:hypothetical protein
MTRTTNAPTRRVGWLESEQGRGHGHANAVVAHAKARM